MRGYLVKIPRLIRWFKPQYLWQGPNADRAIYLTFDDGPTLACTPFVLSELGKRNQKATFFCLGRQVEQHPDLVGQIIADGHSVGSHSYSHPKLKSVSEQTYLDDVKRGHEVLEATIHQPTNLFRPPYGKLTGSLARSIIKQGHQIVIWDVMPGDFDATRSADQILKDTIEAIEPGSIIVLHDSQQCFEILQEVLPDLLDAVRTRGYTCKPLQMTH